MIPYFKALSKEARWRRKGLEQMAYQALGEPNRVKDYFKALLNKEPVVGGKTLGKWHFNRSGSPIL